MATLTVDDVIDRLSDTDVEWSDSEESDSEDNSCTSSEECSSEVDSGSDSESDMTDGSSDSEAGSGRGCGGGGRGRGRGGRGGRGGRDQGRGQGRRGRPRGRGGRQRQSRSSDLLDSLNWIDISGSVPDTPPDDVEFTATPGFHVDLSALTDPLDCFSLVFTDEVWQFLVDHTNSYATAHLQRVEVRRRSMYRNWKPVTIVEMKAFVGLILNMGIIQLPNLKDYWRKDSIADVPFFRSVFSRDRFFQIFNLLHVGDIDSPDKMSKIQPLLQLLLPKFTEIFTPAKQVAVDESVITFKGRVSFRQYLKGKPHPWGIKAFVLCDSSTGYMCNVSIYYGSHTALVRPELPHTLRVVLTLVQNLHDKGYDLYVDRFYNSPLLALELEKIGISITGTVMSNRKGLPAAMKKRQKLPKGSINAYRAGNLLALSWMDKRKVQMLTSKYSKNTVQVTSQRHKDRPAKTKPEAVAEYNKYMLGVDKMDQLGTYYSFLRKSVKWWRKVFFWFLEVATLNTYILYRHTQVGRRQRLKDLHLTYRRSVIAASTTPLISSTAVQRRTKTHGLERLRSVPHFQTKTVARNDCVVCSDRKTGRHLTLYICQTCTNKPYLCPGECFQKYHTLHRYK